MSRFRAASAAFAALAMILLGGGGVNSSIRPARAEPDHLTRSGAPASQTVDGFTLSPTKGPANQDATATLTPPAPPTNVRFTRISAGGWHSLAIGSDGNTYAWGYNTYGQLGDGNTQNSQPVRVHTPAGVRFTQ
ncbi:hypothetical protein, partial [Bifidobacterium actinocoloniiforme]|uniref:hypothetical protein n=1 Tax=Bifidobacterium actinocoloniiforme TaxID=638619 RepID=UPI000529A727